jgi:hypothetical protein
VGRTRRGNESWGLQADFSIKRRNMRLGRKHEMLEDEMVPSPRQHNSEKKKYSLRDFPEAHK